MLHPADLIPYARNAKKHDDAQVMQIAGSIKEFGFNAPVLIDQSNGIIAGHGRVMAALKLGLESIPVIRLTHLDDIQRRAYILADNRLAENGGGWDEEMLKIELKALKESGIDELLSGFSEEDFAELLADDEEGEGEGGSKYTKKITTPVYVPTGEKPSEGDLFDETTTRRLVSDIEAEKSLTDEERRFLLAAAERHTVFNFERIAEFYAHSRPEVQRLMEDSALVIIDFDAAIEKGFVKVSEDIRQAYIDEIENEDA
jgi:hypothetical protein